MKKIDILIIVTALLSALSAKLNAQCTGGRYHDLVFPGNPVVTYNVVYGSNLNYLGTTDSLKMDIYEPACDNGTNRALVVFAHGGSFVTGDKLDAGYVQTAVALAQLGYVVANINYRLGFETTFPAVQYSFNSAIMRGVHDARAAIRYCRNNALNGANTWRIDPNNIFFGGASAGGIIALHLAYQNLQSEHNMSCNNQAGSECSSIEGTSNTLAVSSSVKAIVSISGGIRDLNWIATNDIPVCLAHGTNDGTVPYGSGTFGGFFPVHGSSSIATRCNTTGTTYCFKPMYGQDHVPSNPAYVDTVATVMRNFLEHFTCNTTLNCNYTSSPVAVTASVSIAITSGTNPTCSGTPVTFTATPINGGASPSYQWKVNGANVGTNSSTYTSSTLANGNAVTCVMTPNAACSGSSVTSNSIPMTVNAAGAPAVAITAGTNPACAGASVTFTATPTNGGTAPSYLWKKNGSNVGTNSSTYSSSSLANNDLIICVMTSNSSCANPTTASDSITMIINAALVPSVAIAVTAGSNPTCAGAPVTFTATPANGGTSSSYQWKKNGSNTGTNSSAYSSSTLVHNDMIACVMTSNALCANPVNANSLPTTMTVNALPVITPNGNVLTSSASSSYEWYLNGQLIPGATSQSHTATASGNYTVIDGNGCQSQPLNVLATSVIDQSYYDYFLGAYPNPNSGKFTVSFNASEKGTYKLELKNVIGVSLYRETLKDFSGFYSRQVDIAESRNGIYMLLLGNSKNEAVKKIVVY